MEDKEFFETKVTFKNFIEQDFQLFIEINQLILASVFEWNKIQLLAKKKFKFKANFDINAKNDLVRYLNKKIFSYIDSLMQQPDFINQVDRAHFEFEERNQKKVPRQLIYDYFVKFLDDEIRYIMPFGYFRAIQLLEGDFPVTNSYNSFEPYKK
ncbi:hypothetical protein ACW95P_00760 [Candidatus Mycoplasma pogonae]